VWKEEKGLRGTERESADPFQEKRRAFLPYAGVRGKRTVTKLEGGMVEKESPACFARRKKKMRLTEKKTNMSLCERGVKQKSNDA